MQPVVLFSLLLATLVLVGVDGKRRKRFKKVRWDDQKTKNDKGGGKHVNITLRNSSSSSSSESNEKIIEKTKKKVSDKNPISGGSSNTILQTLQDDKRFLELSKLINTNIDVQRILSDASRQVTLFAPTNVAVKNRGAALTDGTRLKTMLKYHIVEGKCSKDELSNGSVRELKTLFIEDAGVFSKLPSGVPQVIILRDGLLITGVQPDATIVSDDPIVCANGFIYQIDVLLIPPLQTPEGLAETPYTAALEAVTEKVYNRAGLTMFLPPKYEWERAAKGDRTAEELARGHVVEGRPVYWGDLWDGMRFYALDGTLMVVKEKGGQFSVNGKRIIRPNIPTNFGVVHLLEGMVEPLSAEEISKQPAVKKNRKHTTPTDNHKATSKGEKEPVKDKTGEQQDESELIEAKKEEARRGGNGAAITRFNVKMSIISTLALLIFYFI